MVRAASHGAVSAASTCGQLAARARRADGSSVAEDRLPTLFGDGVSTRGPDRGLGLGIVRSTAESLGGTVAVGHPGGEGAMTVFVATLPQVLAATGMTV